MRKYIFAISMLGLSLALPVVAADVTPADVKVEGGRVTVSMDIDLDRVVVNANQRCELTPVVCASPTGRKLRLPPVVVVGHNRMVTDLRWDREIENATEVLRAKDAHGTYAYRQAFDYEPWMEEARLTLETSTVGCGCELDGERVDTLSQRLLYAPKFQLADLAECPVTFIPRSEKRDAYIIYPVNKTTLLPDRYNNKVELRKIAEAFRLIRENGDYEIQKIHISGWASPEGSEAHNRTLAKGRAEALSRYLVETYAIDRSMIVVDQGGENWAELRQFVAASQMEGKNRILHIIDTESDLDRREALIRQIDNGKPYASLLATAYPNLRKNTIDISYITRERDITKAKELVFSNPNELNVYEFYNVANKHYANDKAGYRRVLSIAADTYEEDVVANANAGILALRDNDTAAARKYLERVVSHGEAWNSYGYLCYAEGNREEAKRWWQKAAEAGDIHAQANLRELEKRGL